MSPQDLFQSLVRDDIAPLLKQFGLKKSGMNFGLRGTDLWGVITVWRDEWNTKDEVNFSITLNVVCDLFRRYNGEKFDPRRVPASINQHWHRPIDPFLHAFLHPERPSYSYPDRRTEVSWTISGFGDLEAIRPQVLTALSDVAVPQLRRRRSLAAFVDLWRTEGEPLPGWLVHQVLTLRLYGQPGEADELIEREVAEEKDPLRLKDLRENLKQLETWINNRPTPHTPESSPPPPPDPPSPSPTPGSRSPTRTPSPT